jgi:hypothetical protein
MNTRLKWVSHSKRSKWIIYPTVALVAINFITFVAASLYLGGDALNGHMIGQHYYLCAHGHCTEVTSALWHYSWWHAVTAIGGILLVMAETAFFLNTGDIKFESS